MVVNMYNFIINLYKMIVIVRAICRAIWFFIIYTPILIYCIWNWKEVISFNSFNGNTVIFIMLIILTFLPFISKFKFGEYEGSFNDPFVNNDYELCKKIMSDININTNNLSEEVKKDKEALLKQVNEIEEKVS